MPSHRHLGADTVLQPTRLPRRPDMNVTPLIDVLLVLLVIFMAALPMAQKGTDVVIPPATSGGRPPDGQVVVELTADRRLAINTQPVSLAELTPRLRDLYRDRRDKTLFLIGAATLPYGEVVAVIDAAKAAGLERVGIVTEGMRRAARAGGA